ncbi:hypothetical protein M408DRAFT_320752 [Serendipita vermifera MAFF 305830]|uniref:Large ribosomal subunit protein uL29m n=1 Tax=Serendipita vermifera MAFF 305830 TaxID=933852 RepID=A0A0C3AW03_SERVB|nr:hypothetical protein M408DRAFT_320752 [Serendipita vermifera MAFF 305830]
MIRPAIRCTTSARIRPLNTLKRRLATIAEEQPTTKSATESISTKLFKGKKPDPGPLRPHLGIKVREDHGLYNFFRKIPKDDALRKFEYVAFEAMDESMHSASRAWTAAELRRKSFRDLHILWYLARREINLLATQRAEIKRLHREVTYGSTPISLRARMCRKTCARIKFVLNERRLALLNATARVHWGHRAGHKDPAKSPKTKLVRGGQMTEAGMNQRIRKMGAKGKLKHLHPELRKRPMLMLKWAPRHGRARPITFACEL